MVFLAKLIGDGRLDFGSFSNEMRWRNFNRENKDKEVRIELPEKNRTLSQNAFYWAYLEIISREYGNTAEELHHFFKEKLLPKRIVKIKGKKNVHEIEMTGSTTKLSKTEMGEYLDKISALCEVPIPDPTQLANYYSVS